MHKFKVITGTSPTDAEIYMDGKKVEGLTDFGFRLGIDRGAKVTMVMYAENIEFEGVALPEEIEIYEAEPTPDKHQLNSFTQEID